MTTARQAKSIKTVPGPSGSGSPQLKAKVQKPATPPQPTDEIVLVLPPSRQVGIHPAQHYDAQKRKWWFGFQLPVEIDKGDGKPPQRKIVNCLVSEKGETIPCIESQLNANSITLMATPLIDKKGGNRISDVVLEQWQNSGGRKPTPWPLPEYLEYVVTCLKETIDFSSEDYFYYLALWTFGTYCHRIFDSFPYVFYNGPTNTGKTRTMEVLERIAFNAVLSPDTSPPSLFRLVQSRSPTLLMDETEKIWDSDKSQEIRKLVLSGYKKAGAALRTEKVGDSAFNVEMYAVYSPKCFANISGLDDVLAGRCISVLMARSRNKAVLTARLSTSARNVSWQDICDQSYLLVYTHYPRIYQIAEQHANKEVVEGIDGRPLELWGSIFVLAQLFEENGCVGLKDRMVRLALQHTADKAQQFRESGSGQLIQATRNMMLNNECPMADGYYRFQDLIPFISQEAIFAEEGIETDKEGHATTTLKVKKPTWLTPGYLTRQFKLLGIDKFRGTGSGRSVFITQAQLVDLWERYMGTWEQPDIPPLQTRADDPAYGGQSPSQDTAQSQTPAPVPARAGPPLSEDVLKVLLREGSRTYGGLRDEVTKLGYTVEEFDIIFKALRDAGRLTMKGTTPVFYGWSEEQ